MNNKNQITILGSGALGTAISNVLAQNENLKITILSIEKDVIKDINTNNCNAKYFPQIKLNKNITATEDNSCLKKSNVIFIAIPSSAVVSYIESISNFINKEAIIVNLSKGFGTNYEPITKSISKIIENKICTLKGPAFARDIILNIPTGMTLGAERKNTYAYFDNIFKKSTIKLDYSQYIDSVEYVSILKNIYAIVMGIVDAHYDSPNLRFLVFTKTFNEIKNILLAIKANDEILFNYCGIGDFGLTALNDLSRNRTLGLLIGKGFFTDDISGKVVLEGRIAAKTMFDLLNKLNVEPSKYMILNELNNVFNGKSVKLFVNDIINK